MPPRSRTAASSRRSSASVSRARAAPRQSSSRSGGNATRHSSSSTTSARKAPTVHQKQAVWSKCSTVRGKNPDVYRRDAKGNVIYKSSYGGQGNMGWEIDHKKPLAKGGTNSTRNLQALQTTANRKKGSNY